MEQSINNLADFSIQLTKGNVRDILDFYIPLSNYCCDNVDEPITDDFNNVIGTKGGVLLVYLKIKIKLLEDKYNRWGNEKILKEIEELDDEYQEMLAKFLDIIKKEHRIG